MITSYNRSKVLLAVDCIIFGFDSEGLKILLVKRDFEPEKDKWTLIGGFLENENLDTAAVTILEANTGLQNIYMEQLYTYGDVNRDPVERTVSVTYYALINIENHNAQLIQNYHAQWFNISEAPELVFDHSKMLEYAIVRLRYRTSIQPIGFELLPEKFKMNQLLKLYESILNKSLDKRNFINKIKSLDIIIKLNEKDMTTSKKGSFLYVFDKEKYAAKLLNNFSLNL